MLSKSDLNGIDDILLFLIITRCNCKACWITDCCGIGDSLDFGWLENRSSSTFHSHALLPEQNHSHIWRLTCPEKGWEGDGRAEEKDERGKNSPHISLEILILKKYFCISPESLHILIISHFPWKLAYFHIFTFSMKVKIFCTFPLAVYIFSFSHISPRSSKGLAISFVVIV